MQTTNIFSCAWTGDGDLRDDTTRGARGSHQSMPRAGKRVVTFRAGASERYTRVVLSSADFSFEGDK